MRNHLLPVALAGWVATLSCATMQTGVRPALPDAKLAGTWELTFADEFDGTALDQERWSVEAGSPGHIQSSRWPENVAVRDGLCRLLTKQEARGGKQWTTGHIWTKTFRQQSGYFEARLKIGGATGLNNAFWLMTPNKKTDPIHFEIDICEAHYPNLIPMNLHNWAGQHWAKSETWKAPDDLSRDFHVYGLEWTDTDLIWYFDGHPIRRLAHTICRAPAVIRLSTAVFPWAGQITDALEGTSMDVDWVRVYQRTQ